MIGLIFSASDMCRTTSLKCKIFLGLWGKPSFPLRGSYKFGIGSVTYSGRFFSFETINNVYNKCLGLEDDSAAGATTFVSSVNCEPLNMLRIIKKCYAVIVIHYIFLPSKISLLPTNEQQNSGNKIQNCWVSSLIWFSCGDVSLVSVTDPSVQKGAVISWLRCWLGTSKTWVLFPQVSQLLHRRNGSHKIKKWWLLMQKKMRIEINLLIFDTKVSFNAYLNALVTRRGICAMLVARLCQVRALVFKSSFNLFWKSVSCHTKSNHAALCTNGLGNSSLSFHREMLLAFTLPSSCGRCSRRSSLLIPADHAWKTTLFSPSPHLKLVFQWFADASLASHINSNSMTRCLVHFSRHTLQS